MFFLQPPWTFHRTRRKSVSLQSIDTSHRLSRRLTHRYSELKPTVVITVLLYKHNPCATSEINSVNMQPASSSSMSSSSSSSSTTASAAALASGAALPKARFNWIFPSDKFTSTPSSRDNILAEEELTLRQNAAVFIYELGTNLKVYVELLIVVDESLQSTFSSQATLLYQHCRCLYAPLLHDQFVSSSSTSGNIRWPLVGLVQCRSLSSESLLLRYSWPAKSKNLLGHSGM